MHFVVGVAMLVAAYACLDAGRAWIAARELANRPVGTVREDLIAILATSLVGFGAVALFTELVSAFDLARFAEFVASLAAVAALIWSYRRLARRAPVPA